MMLGVVAEKASTYCSVAQQCLVWHLLRLMRSTSEHSNVCELCTCWLQFPSNVWCCACWFLKWPAAWVAAFLL